MTSLIFTKIHVYVHVVANIQWSVKTNCTETVKVANALKTMNFIFYQTQIVIPCGGFVLDLRYYVFYYKTCTYQWYQYKYLD